jgi:signal peptide peptidase SppA
MNTLPHLAQKLFNTPLCLQPGKAEMVMAALADRFGVARLFGPNGAVPLPMPDLAAEDDGPAPARGYEVLAGVALIPIQGTLVQRVAGLRPYSGMTGYNGIRANLLMALADAKVRAIALDIDSPGGEVASLFDLVDTIAAMRGRKPIWAMLNENACSAAYALASAASKISVPRTGLAGSIGVIMLLADLSRAMESAGITVNVVTFGAQKTDGLDCIPLSDPARARIQSMVNTVGALFVDTVARNRNLTPAKVLGTEAGVFMGQEAVAAGLADFVAPPDLAFRRLVSTL